MDDRATMQAEHDEALKRLLALGLSVCEKVEARLQAAESDEELQARTLAFTRAARSVRQTIALRERLLRDTERAAREAETAAHTRRTAAKDARRQRVSYILEREIEDGADPDDEVALTLVLHQLLAEDMLDDDFAERPLEPYLADLRVTLGLPESEPGPQAEPEPVHAFANTS